MAFAISFGTNSKVKNGSDVSFESTLVAPTILMQGVLPGFHTLTIVDLDKPYVHYIKVNMSSTARGGSNVVEYEPPSSAPLPSTRQRFAMTLWRQSGGRLTPPPRGPVSRARFSLDRFAKKHGLVEIATVGYVVRS
jgi:hypothetical protein